MSTRSRIAIQTTSGYESVYCHFDGYPHGLGVTLNNFFPTKLDAHSLVAQGDVSAIDFDNGAVDRYTDRGEAFIEVQPIRSKNLNELLKLTVVHLEWFVGDRHNLRGNYTLSL